MNISLVEDIRKRYQHLLSKITDATIRSGRDEGSVRLMVVSKSQPLEVVRAAITAGINILGENYAEEAVAKMASLNETGVEWHMIGHVQSRKSDLVAEHFSMLHSLDSVKLAGRLDRNCSEAGRILPVLLEVNVSGEETKFGFPAWDDQNWSDLVPIFEQVISFSGLRVEGLMTMPPFYENPEKVRPYFRRLRHLQEFMKNRLPQVKWTHLSMGTSVDYLIAVEEGATYVRVGQAILGLRSG